MVGLIGRINIRILNVDYSKTINIQPGRYVLAVSGGVDSMALLHMLSLVPDVHLTVAHFDHGIREDSALDRRLVQEMSKQYKLPFVYKEGGLDRDASEEIARKARYEFLRDVQRQVNANAIITAHHLDDMIETAIHNMIRGTGRKGLSSLNSKDGLLRPALHLSKQQLKQYALDNGLVWREDSTNLDTKIKRNYIRHIIIPKLKNNSPEKYEMLKKLIKRQHEVNKAIDGLLDTFLHLQPSKDCLRRRDVTSMPHGAGRELVSAWLRSNGIRNFNKNMVEKITIGMKTAKPHSVITIDSNTRVFFELKNAKILRT